MHGLNHGALLAHTFVESIVEMDSTHSTNTAALAEPCDFSILYYTPNQTAGRGRGSNAWMGGPGCLTFTVTLPATAWPLSVPVRPRVSLITALALADAIDEHAIIQLKWPNDVMAAGKKLAGILVEPHPGPSGGLVIGVGLNLTNDVAGIDKPAIALADFGSFPNPDQILLPFLQILEPLLKHLLRDQLPLSRAWAGRCWLTGKTVRLDHGLTGICQGITDQGALRIETPTGIKTTHGGIVSID